MRIAAPTFVVIAILAILFSAAPPSHSAHPPHNAPTPVEEESVCRDYPHTPVAQRITSWVHTIHHGLMGTDGLEDAQIECSIDLTRVAHLDRMIAQACVADPDRDFEELSFNLLKRHLAPCKIDIIRGD